MPDYKSVVVSTTDKKKNKKKKKENAALAIVKGLIPWKGDSVGEIIRKIVFLVSIVALCVAVLIIIDKYMFEPERQRNLKRIFTAITVRTVLFLRIMRTNSRIRAKRPQIRSFTVITCVPKTSLPK